MEALELAYCRADLNFLAMSPSLARFLPCVLMMTVNGVKEMSRQDEMDVSVDFVNEEFSYPGQIR